MSPTPGVPTGVAIVAVTPDGQNAIIVAPGADAKLLPQDVAACKETLARAAVVVIRLEIPAETVGYVGRSLGGATLLLNCAPFVPCRRDY